MNNEQICRSGVFLINQTSNFSYYSLSLCITTRIDVFFGATFCLYLYCVFCVLKRIFLLFDVMTVQFNIDEPLNSERWTEFLVTESETLVKHTNINTWIWRRRDKYLRINTFFLGDRHSQIKRTMCLFFVRFGFLSFVGERHLTMQIMVFRTCMLLLICHFNVNNL